jgi:hypothetical protein
MPHLGSVIATAVTTLAMLALRSGTLPAGHKQALVAGAEA